MKIEHGNNIHMQPFSLSLPEGMGSASTTTNSNAKRLQTGAVARPLCVSFLNGVSIFCSSRPDERVAAAAIVRRDSGQ